MFILLFLLMFSGCAYGQTIDDQIISIDSQITSTLAQRDAIINNPDDADIQLLKRLKDKTAQQRALADKANDLRAQKEALMKQKSEIVISLPSVETAGTNWTNLETISP